jgi:hypothetical protein
MLRQPLLLAGAAPHTVKFFVGRPSGVYLGAAAQPIADARCFCSILVWPRQNGSCALRILPQQNLIVYYNEDCFAIWLL